MSIRQISTRPALLHSISSFKCPVSEVAKLGGRWRCYCPGFGGREGFCHPGFLSVLILDQASLNPADMNK